MWYLRARLNNCATNCAATRVVWTLFFVWGGVLLASCVFKFYIRQHGFYIPGLLCEVLGAFLISKTGFYCMVRRFPFAFKSLHGQGIVSPVLSLFVVLGLPFLPRLTVVLSSSPLPLCSFFCFEIVWFPSFRRRSFFPIVNMRFDVRNGNSLPHEI